MTYTITPLSKEALRLCGQLSKAYHADCAKRDILGRPSGDAAYQRKNRRIWRKACDRWRRRAGMKIAHEQLIV
jgi:hypothetical protein